MSRLRDIAESAGTCLNIVRAQIFKQNDLISAGGRCYCDLFPQANALVQLIRIGEINYG